MTIDRTAYQEAINSGHSAAWDQDWKKAAQFYQLALYKKPEDKRALSSLAHAFFQLGEEAKSLKFYLRVARLTPDDPMPLEKAATIYESMDKHLLAAEAAIRAADLHFKNEEITKAIENWSRAVGLNPEHIRAHSRLAIVYERLGKKDQAVREYLHVASLMQHAGEDKKAKDAVNRALNVSPTNEEAKQALIVINEAALLPKPARPRGGTGPLQIARVQSTVEENVLDLFVTDSLDSGLDPIEETSQTALSALAAVIFDRTTGSLGTSAPKRDLFSIVQGSNLEDGQFTGSKSMLSVAVNRAVDLHTKDNFLEASSELEKAIELGLDNSAGIFDLGFLKVKTDQYEAAIPLLQKSLRHYDYALGARLLLGKSFLALGKVNEAAIEYLEAMKLADVQVVPPAKADELRKLYEPLIEAQARRKDEEVNHKLSRNISEMIIRPHWRNHLKELRSELITKSSDDPLMPIAELLTEASSNEVIEDMAKVRKLAGEGKTRAAMEEAFFALHNAPTYLPLHITIGDLLLNEGHLPEAIEKFMVIAHSYSVKGETARAIDVYRRVVDMAPIDLLPRISLIEQLVDYGNIEAAISEHLDLAGVHYNMAEIPEARKIYAAALKLSQTSGIDPVWKVRTLHRIADIDSQTLNWREALNIFDQIRTLKSFDMKAWRSVIDLNFRLGQDAQAYLEVDNFISQMNLSGKSNLVIELLADFAEDRPKDVKIHRRLASHYRQVGKFTNSLNQYKIAKDLALENNDIEGAKDDIQAILGLNPPNASEYEELLQTLSD